MKNALDMAISLGGDGLVCHPCREDKSPACPHGFKDGSRDAAALRDLWRRYPGPLVGVATGEESGVDVLDLDRKHSEACEWWGANRHRLPQTRVHRTRSGGLHVVFRHAPGLRCWAGRPVVGVDGRGSGGYVVWWPAAGLPVLCDAPAAPWPDWLLDELTVQPAIVSTVSTVSWRPAAPVTDIGAQLRYGEAALRSATDRVQRAGEGSRNATLNSEAHGLGRLVLAGLLDAQRVADELASAALGAGLAPREIVATLRSAFRARGLT